MSSTNDGSVKQWRENMKKEGIFFVSQGFVYVFKGPKGSAMKIHEPERLGSPTIAGESYYPYAQGVSDDWSLPDKFSVSVGQMRRWPQYSVEDAAADEVCTAVHPGEYTMLSGPASHTHEMRLAARKDVTYDEFVAAARVKPTGIQTAHTRWWDDKGKTVGARNDVSWRAKKSVQKITKEWRYKKAKKKGWFGLEL